MMTTTKARPAAAILALDLGKYKSVACLARPAGPPHFETIPTGRAELARLVDRHHPNVVLIEACLLKGKRLPPDQMERRWQTARALGLRPTGRWCETGWTPEQLALFGHHAG
jgi:hypothetical protein